MGSKAYWVLLTLGALWARAEIIDRVAVTVDRIVITDSDIVNQVRISAFLNSEPSDLGPVTRKQAAERLVEQVLIRREMEISRYPAPSLSQADQILEQLKKQRFPDAETYLRALEDYGVREEDLRENLLLQMTTLRFIEFRFRPAAAVTDEEISEYYRERLLPEWEQGGSGAAPALDDTREDIQEILIAERVNQYLDQWLEQAKQQSRIEFREVGFR
jgi:hypothetical protein